MHFTPALKFNLSRLRRYALVGLFALLLPILAWAASALEYGQTMSCTRREGVPAGQGSPDVLVYTNRTAANVNMTGDLLVKKNSCPVRVTFGPGPADTYLIPHNANDETKDSSTVTVPAGARVTIHCQLMDNIGNCEWKFQRSSP